MKHAQSRATTLIEALPYLQRFTDRTVVIKCGGHTMVDDELKASFATDVTLLKQVGVNPVVVHGGGPQIGRMLEKIGKRANFVSGMRITDSETMDVVEMVLAGLVNKEIVANINHAGGKAVGLSGKDGGLICARKLEIKPDTSVQAQGFNVPETIDLGHVGQVKHINTGILELLEQDRFIPVIAPVGYDKPAGARYNINADSVAGAIAMALGAAKLILLTNVPGVLDADKNLKSRLSTDEARQWIDSGIIEGGMIPKVNCCLDAVSHGVSRAHIIDGRVSHAVLLEILTDEGIGTVFMTNA